MGAAQTRKLLEKRSAVPTPQIVYCNTKLETIAPDGIDILHSKTKTFPHWFVRTLCVQPSSEVVKIKKDPIFEDF